MISVAIANDTLIALSILQHAIATNPAYELIWSAKNGIQAVERCEQETPDLMLMDLRMPGLDGAEATRQIMATSPCAILIVTGSVSNNTSKIFEAMGYGALDVVSTPVGDTVGPLLKKMATITAFIGKSIRRESVGTPGLRSLSGVAKLPPLIVIGASTGGPRAIAQILQALPPDCPAAIVIVQHIDQQFAPSLTSWLSMQSQLSVRLVVEGTRMRAGNVYVATGGQHLVMGADYALRYLNNDFLQDEFRTPYRPSVDVFFNSVAKNWPQKGQAVLLTGRGRDGAMWLKSLRSAAWHTIAESEESCVVYGMPRAAVENGAAGQILPIQKISQALLERLAERVFFCGLSGGLFACLCGDLLSGLSGGLWGEDTYFLRRLRKTNKPVHRFS